MTEATLDEIVAVIGAVPVRGTTTGTPPVVTVRLPVRIAPAVGPKVTMAVHEPLAVSNDPQLFVCKKSPDVEMLSIGSDVAPELDMVATWGELTVPMDWLGNVRGPGEIVIEGAWTRYACVSSLRESTPLTAINKWSLTPTALANVTNGFSGSVALMRVFRLIIPPL
jgi:hypothetical protein